MKLIDSEDFSKMVQRATDYQHGNGVEKNLDVAIGLLCTAARKGSVSAQYELGWLYLNSRHGHSSDRQAAAWLSRAAKNGDEHAQRLLRFTAPSDAEDHSHCPLSNGYEFLPPIHTKPNPSVKEIKQWVARLSPHYRLSPQLVIEVIRMESNFNVRAKSPKNAQGLMQLIPATAKRFGVNNVWDPLQNIQGGMAYLRWLLDHFRGDITLALAGYNAGEKAVNNYGGIPPYNETQHYVKAITKKLNKALARKL
ncbi:MAG: transglycosylase SLT domain-containing protein [Motiliproteus sp.]|nr:transglycosylase SLT domain-containing protein [Motiliproteus sp.]MCW9051402.1 transglycosylase SLT domain-containing protein [Motiliproteus sp.]